MKGKDGNGGWADAILRARQLQAKRVFAHLKAIGHTLDENTHGENLMNSFQALQSQCLSVTFREYSQRATRQYRARVGHLADETRHSPRQF